MHLTNMPVAEPIPAGKRTVHHNIYGNAVAYVAGRRWNTLGETHDPHTATLIADFLNTDSVETLAKL
jgi:hypothetical protein